MILFVNDKGEIKDVDFTKDTSLIPLEVNDVDNPFIGWSVAKICCYRVTVSDGRVTMMTPYIDSRLLEHIDQLGKQVEAVTPYMDSQRAYIGDTSVVFVGVKNGLLTPYCETDNGSIIPTRTERSGDRVTVLFEYLTEVATVTISVI